MAGDVLAVLAVLHGAGQGVQARLQPVRARRPVGPKIPSSAGDLCRVGVRPERPNDLPSVVPGRFTGRVPVLRKAASGRCSGTFAGPGRAAPIPSVFTRLLGVSQIRESPTTTARPAGSSQEEEHAGRVVGTKPAPRAGRLRRDVTPAPAVSVEGYVCRFERRTLITTTDTKPAKSTTVAARKTLPRSS